MGDDESKILVFNPNPDYLDKVLAKANSQNAKLGPFAATILMGDVLPSDKPLPQTELLESTYFAKGLNGINSEVEAKASESSSTLVDVAENLTYVKPPYSIIKLVSGITMLIVSGELSKDSLDKIVQTKAKIDLLFTFRWPTVLSFIESVSEAGNETIDSLVKLIKPKYHFAVGKNEGGVYREVEPFKWPSGEITRFISLAQEGSADKWFYAFSISDKQDEVASFMENPFLRKKRSIENKGSENKAATKKAKVVTPDQCFFCLSNPKTETHMIVSIGSQAYLTVAKGPLTRSNKDLSFSGHGIIIPIQHVANVNDRDGAIRQEINKFQQTLVKAFAKQKPFLKLIFFELNRHNNVHHNVQFLPVYEPELDKFSQSLEYRRDTNNEKFKRNQKLEFVEFTNEDDSKLEAIEKENDYIKFTISISEEESKIYIAKLTKGEPVDIQFPSSTTKIQRNGRS
ncbi:hypothetical protein CANMA_005036 [Candida margitis]|uniref:uncharacterized protein n=1 Tax=Candida margitis TaxID=1775924 RepID=UPI002227DDE4|nr:uncharacterized protein CANMA_005036 [Candida margitis]KAI5953011.1 hypothetical protein CANMA_005036 [Candida margitis]